MTTANPWQPSMRRRRVKLYGASLAAIAGLDLLICTGSHLTVLVAFGLIATVAVGLMPFEIVCPLLVLVTVFTHFSMNTGGLHLRPDMALVPAAYLSCLNSGYGPAFARWTHHPVIKGLAAFVALNFAVSLIASPQVRKSETIALWYLIDLVIVLLALAYYTGRRDSLERHLYRGAWIAVGYGLIAWAVNAAGHHIPGTSHTEGLRTYGIAYEPNILAGTAAIWIVVLLTRGGRLRRSEKLFCLLASAAIVLTATRTAFLAIAAGVVISWLAVGIGGRVMVRAFWSIAAFALGAAFLDFTLPTVVAPLVHKLTHLNFNNQTASYRFDSWHVAFGDLHSWHWLFGLGTNSFGMRHIDPTSIYQLVPSPGYLGNLPLDILYDTGLVGLGILGVVAWRLVKLYPGSGRRVRRFAIAATFLVIATGTSPFFFSYFWLFIALALLPRLEQGSDGGIGVNGAGSESRSRELAGA